MSILSTKIIILCVLHKVFHFILDECCEAPTIFWCFNFYVFCFEKYPVLSDLPADEGLSPPPPPPPPPPHSHGTILRHVRLCNTELLGYLPVNPKRIPLDLSLKTLAVNTNFLRGFHEHVFRVLHVRMCKVCSVAARKLVVSN